MWYMFSKNTIWTAGLVYCSAVWGTTFFVIKDALNSADPIAFVGYRMLLAALCLLPLILFSKRKIAANLKEGALFGFILVILYITQSVGLQYTSASNAAFILGLFVVFIPLCLWLFFKFKILGVQWLASLMAVAGLWIITGGINGINKGDVLAIISAMAYAWHVVLTNKYVRAEADVVMLMFHQFWMCGVFCIMLAAGMGHPLAITSSKGYFALGYLVLIPTLSAFFVQLYAQKVIHPLKVSLIFAAEPVFGAAFAWTFGGESFTYSALIGGLVIVAAIVVSELSPYLVELRRRRKEAKYLKVRNLEPPAETPPQ